MIPHFVSGFQKKDRLGTQLYQRCSGQNGVHGTRPEALGIERDIGKAQRFEDARELREHFHVQRLFQLIARDLNPSNLAVMAYTELLETQSAQGVLAFFHGSQRFTGDRASILDPRRRTRGSRLLPEAQPGLARQLPDIALGQSSLKQRRRDSVVLRRHLSWTEITLVVNIDSISNRMEAVVFREALHHQEQLIFAMKAARSVIANVLRPLHLLGLDHLKRNPLLFRESNCILQVRPRQTG